MFTGIVTAIGTIVDTTSLGTSAAFGLRLAIEAPRCYLDGVALGDSIALNGACMTVASLDAQHSHFEVDVWPDLGPRATALLRIVSHCLVLVFALVFVWWGIQFVRFGWDQLSELAELPMPWIFIAWPLSGVTWVLFLGESFIQNWRVLFGAPAP